MCFFGENMAGKICKPCPVPRCPNHVPDGRRYCDAHQEEAPAAFSLKHKPRNPFYSTAAWLKARAYKLSIQKLCEDCKKAAATEVHHRIPLEERPDLSVTLTNLEALCKSCHAAESQREARDSRRKAREKTQGY